MATVWIPALLRDLTGGKETITVQAKNVAEAIDALDGQYPGIKLRILDGERIRPGLSVVVDGVVSSRKLRHPLGETSEVHFLPAFGGGAR